MPRITGIGGIFFKVKGDKTKIAAWYQQHLGIPLEPWGGAILSWPLDQGEDRGLTVWSLAERDSEWFAPSTSSMMVNYRVDDLLGLLQNLEQADIKPIKGPEFHENGVFAWIMDPDGNKVELWEPKLWDDKNKREA